VQATKEAFEAARALTKKLQSKEGSLVGAQVNFKLDIVDVFVQQAWGVVRWQ
jgi:hypothetical protein